MVFHKAGINRKETIKGIGAYIGGVAVCVWENGEIPLWVKKKDGQIEIGKYKTLKLFYNERVQWKWIKNWETKLDRFIRINMWLKKTRSLIRRNKDGTQN